MGTYDACTVHYIKLGENLLQEELENKIEVADALAVKLHQRFSYSVSAMKTTSQHLSEGILLTFKTHYICEIIGCGIPFY